MLKSERKQLILNRLLVDGFVTLETLTQLLETSESTVRRDLDELEAAGKLRRVHGGAEKIQTLQEELTNQEKSIKNVQDKRRLVERTGQLIEAGDVIFIDAGTTTELLLDYLPDKDIMVVTNSIHHASKLVDKQIKTMIIGGLVKQSTDASVGRIATSQIEQLNFDKAFMGMNGIDDENLTTPELEEAMVKKAIIQSSKATFVLADSSKLGQKSFVKVAHVSEVTIVTNQSENDIGLLDNLRGKTQVILV